MESTHVRRGALVEGHAESRLVGLLVPLGLAVLLAVLWFARFNPITDFAPGADDGLYLYIGQQLLKGAAPYRDVFDNKGPLLYLVNALGLALGAGSFWGVYVLEYCLLAASSVLTYVVLKARVGWLVAGAATLFFVLEVGHIAGGDHEEEYAVVLQCLALFLLFRKPSTEPRLLLWFVSGLLAAGAFFLKPTGLGFWGALLVTVLLICLSAGEWRKWLRRVFVGVAGAAAATAALLVYLAVARALGLFVADYFGFNFMYVGTHGMADRLSSIGYGAGQLGYLAIAAVALAWMLTLRRVLRRAGERTDGDVLALLTVVWLPVEVVLAATSGYSRVQYYFPWLLPATLLLAFGLVEMTKLGRRAPEGGRLSPGWTAAALLVAVAFAGLLTPTATILHNLAGSVLHYRSYSATTSQAEQVAAYVDAHTSPADEVLVWGGYNATVNLLAKRRSPTRYVMQLALYHEGYAAKGVPEFLRELKAHPPALVLDTSPTYGQEWGVAVPPLAATSNPWASSPAPVAAAWAAVYSYLREHYRSAGRLEFTPGWPVYVPR